MRFLLALILTVCAVLPVKAQDAPTALLADTIVYDPERDALIATGNVEIVYDGSVLRAAKITYFNQTGRVEADGDLTLSAPGAPTIAAAGLTIDSQLERGLIQGARLVLAENFQIAANEARQIDDKRTALYKSVASACQVCNSAETPLWLIRAERVVRDEEDLQIHFQNVRFEAFGVTLAYLPYFRMADPSIDRATGFLTPNFTRSDFYGYGIKMPYYIVVAGDRDITLTPFYTSRGAKLLEGEYRQQFQKGMLQVDGAFTLLPDRADDDRLRGYISIDGQAELPFGFEFLADITNTSDKGFMRQYGYSNADRLRGEILATRALGNEYVSAGMIGFQTLRDGETNASIPNALPEITYDRYWDDLAIGGRLEAQASTSYLRRQNGRDVLEFALGTHWQNEFQLPAGVVGKVFSGVDGQLFITRDDANFDSDPTPIIVPRTGAELRWPLIRTSQQSTQVIEPVVQAIYSRPQGDQNNVPNEDSPAVEFDAANLFALDRYPGNDAHEEGLRFNIGANYTRIDPDGWSVAMTFGQVYRDKTQTGFPDNTGLNQLNSNFVASVNFDLPKLLRVSNQSLFDNNLNFERNDVQFDVHYRDFELDGSYVYLAADPTNASAEQHELSLETRYRIADHWVFDASWRRNLATGDNVSASAGIAFGNECLQTRFSLSRRFTNSTSLPPGTDFGLTVRLAGFGGSDVEFPARRCVQLQ